MIPWIAAKWAATALLRKSAGDALAKVPRWAWYALLAIVLLVALVIWHGHKLKAHDAALVASTIATRDAQWKARLDQAHADALAWRTKFEAAHAQLAQKIKEERDAQVRAINAAADHERVLGPGKAAAANYCRQGGDPALASAAGGHDGPVSQPADAVAGVLEGDRAAVPWGWLVSSLQQCDITRSEASAWRRWYVQMKGLWPTQ